MWPLPAISSQSVTISFSPCNLVCSWFQENKDETYTLKAHQRIPLHNLELEKATIFNPSFLGKAITQFLHEYHLEDASVYASVKGPIIFEKIVSLPTSSPEPGDFRHLELKKQIWDYIYLYPTATGQFSFYLCGIKRDLLFQYQLLAIKNKINLISLAPYTLSLLHLYKYLQGNQFRHSQLGCDLMNNQHQAEQLFTPEMIKQVVIKDPTISIELDSEIPFLLDTLGLFVTRNQNHANH